MTCDLILSGLHHVPGALTAAGLVASQINRGSRCARHPRQLLGIVSHKGCVFSQPPSPISARQTPVQCHPPGAIN